MNHINTGRIVAPGWFINRAIIIYYRAFLGIKVNLIYSTINQTCENFICKALYYFLIAFILHIWHVNMSFTFFSCSCICTYTYVYRYLFYFISYLFSLLTYVYTYMCLCVYINVYKVYCYNYKLTKIGKMNIYLQICQKWFFGIKYILTLLQNQPSSLFEF